MDDAGEQYDKLEAKSPRGAWFDVDMPLMRDEGKVRVHYNGYDNNYTDQVWSLEAVKNWKPLRKFIRVAPAALKDDECHLLELNKPVCAFYKDKLKLEGWYNATVTKIKKQTHKARRVVGQESEICRCIFDVGWRDGPEKGFHKRGLKCRDIRTLSNKDVETHPLLIKLLRHDVCDMGGAQQDKDDKNLPSSRNIDLPLVLGQSPGMSLNSLPRVNQRYEQSVRENINLHKIEDFSGQSTTAKVEPEPSNVNMKQKTRAEFPAPVMPSSSNIGLRIILGQSPAMTPICLLIQSSEKSIPENITLHKIEELPGHSSTGKVETEHSNVICLSSDESEDQFEDNYSAFARAGTALFTSESELTNSMPGSEATTSTGGKIQGRNAPPGQATIEITCTNDQQLPVAKLIDKSRYYVLKIENLERGVQPSDVLARLSTFNFYDRKKIRSVDVPPVSFPEMNYSVAYVVFLDKETADAAVVFFNYCNLIVLSESGKPWIISDQVVEYQRQSGLEDHFGSPAVLAAQDGSSGGSIHGGFKIVTTAQQPEYKAAHRRIKLFQEQKSQTQRMLRRQAEEDRELEAKLIDVWKEGV